MTIKFIIKEKYEQIKKLQLLKDFTTTIKDQFLNEELWNTTLKGFDEEIKKLRNEIKELQ